MNGISKALRFRVLARDGFRCRYCGAGADVAELHVDHIAARASGGGNHEGNLVTACVDCNLGKSDRALSGSAVPRVTVTNRRGKLAAKRDRRNRSPHLVRKGDPYHHVLNTGAADGLGRVFGADQFASLWCESHQRYESHRVAQDMIGRIGTLVRVAP